MERSLKEIQSILQEKKRATNELLVKLLIKKTSLEEIYFREHHEKLTRSLQAIEAHLEDINNLQESGL